MSYQDGQFRPRGVPNWRSRGRGSGYRGTNPRMPFRGYPNSAERYRYIASVDYSSERAVHSYREENEKRVSDRSRSPREGHTVRGKERSRDHSEMDRDRDAFHDKASRRHESRYHDKGNKAPAPHDTKIAAVEKAKEMALRTREIISKLGGLKQLTSVPDSSDSSPHEARDSAVVDPTQLPSTRRSPPKKVAGKDRRIGSRETKTAFKKIMQNESLIKYAFTLPMDDDSDEYLERKTEPGVSEQSVDCRRSTKAVSIEREAVSMDSEPYETSEEIESSPLFDYSYGMPSTNTTTSWVENSAATSVLNLPAAVTTKASDVPGWKGGTGIDSVSSGCDPTIANILKSIGFNFNMSNLMQEKAVQEKVVTTAVASDLKSTVAPLSSSARVLAQHVSESSKVKFTQSNVTHQSYQDMAQQYRVQQQKELGLYNAEAEPAPKSAPMNPSSTSLQQLQANYDASDVPFREDIFRDTSPGMKLKFKVADVKTDKKEGPMYEDFSDSDESFADTACGKPSISDSFDMSVATSELSTGNEQPLTGGSGHVVARTSAAEEHDWVQSTEEFIRKLQQPRVQPPAPMEKQSVRQVTIKSKKQSNRSGSMPRGENVVEPKHAANTSDCPKDHIKLMETIMPLEELKNIKKTIVVGHVGGTVKSSVSDKSDIVENNVRASRSSDRSDSRNDTRTPSRFEKSDVRSESNKNKDRNVADKSRESERGSDTKEKSGRSSKSALETDDTSKNTSKRTASSSVSRESVLTGFPPAGDQKIVDRQKRIKALVKELEGLRLQQSALWRRKKREKDGHKDPILIENSKLQEEICNQIAKLKKACKDIAANTSQKSPVKTPPGSKIEDDKSLAEKEKTTIKKNKPAARSKAEEKKLNRNSNRERSESAERNESEVVKPLKKQRKNEYFDGGNHFCRNCNHVSVNIFEHCQHLLTAAHKQNMDSSYKPWTKLPVKLPYLNTPEKIGNIVSLRLRGVEFLMPTDAYFCTLCDEFIGSSALAETHFKSELHNKHYRRYVADNPYYERRLDLEISAMAMMAPKTQPQTNEAKALKISDQAIVASGSMQLAMEEAKARAKRLASLSKQEEEYIDILQLPVKKSRVIPKASSVVHDEEKLAELLLSNNDSSKPDVGLDKAVIVETAQASSDIIENKVLPETSSKAELPALPVKKSLPFIGKRPNLKNVRSARNVSSEQPIDTTKFNFPFMSDVVEAIKKEEAPMELAKTASMTNEIDCLVSDNAHVVDMDIDDSDDLGSFLTIGNSQSGKFRSVPVVKAGAIGPPTLSTFLLLSQSEDAKCSSQLASTNKVKSGEDPSSAQYQQTDKPIQDSASQMTALIKAENSTVSANIDPSKALLTASISMAKSSSETATALNFQAEINCVGVSVDELPKSDKMISSDTSKDFGSIEKSLPKQVLNHTKSIENQASCVSICNRVQLTTESDVVDNTCLSETNNACLPSASVPDRESCNQSSPIISATTKVVPIQTLDVENAATEVHKNQLLSGKCIPNGNDLQRIVTSEIGDIAKNASIAEKIVSMDSASSSENVAVSQGKCEQRNNDVKVSPSPIGDDNDDEATEGYPSTNEPVQRVVRDEEVANLLPGIAEQFMQPATSGAVEMAVNFGDFEVIDECDADEDDETA